MLNLDVTLFNFRCFSDQNPARYTISNGVTAFVGPNNSGKSSLLRMFFELRNTFRHLQDVARLRQLLTGSDLAADLSMVSDASALQCDENQRPMRIRIDSPDINAEDEIAAVEFCFNRGNPTAYAASFFYGRERNRINSNANVKLNADGRVRSAESILRISDFMEAVRPLTNTIYIGPFRNILNEGGSDYFDLKVGTSFVGLWDSWKNGDERSKNRAVKAVEDSIRTLFGFSRLEINPSPDKRKLRVFVDSHSFDLQEQGAGLAQFILVYGTAAVRSPAIIFINEPELNLHPSLQLDFIGSLGAFASDALVFASHSIGLARSAADAVYSVKKTGAASELRLFEATTSAAEFAGEMNYSSCRELGYDQLLLVEGPTDARVMQQLLRKQGADRRVVVFPLLGHAFASGRHQDSLVELLRVAPAEKIAAIVDSERTAPDAQPDSRRTAFRAACESLGIRVALTERRAMENYFSDRAIKEVLGEDYEALEPFERLEGRVKKWNKALNWKIANVMTLDELQGTDLLDFLRSL